MLNLPDSPRKLVFRALVKLFQDDRDLARTINNWYVWDGAPTSITPIGTGILPATWITPLGVPASSETNVSQSSPFGITLTIATQGFNADDLLDLWSAFERSLFKGDGTKVCRVVLQESLQSNPGAVGSSITQVMLGMPAVTIQQADTGQGMMVATGTIMVQMLVPK